MLNINQTYCVDGVRWLKSQISGTAKNANVKARAQSTIDSLKV